MYRKYIGRFIFRKLNLGIGISLLVVFILLGVLTYSSFYKLLEQREQQLLNMRTENLKLHLTDMIERFKRETISIYKDKFNNQSTGINEYFLSGNVPKADDEQGNLAERNFLNGVISAMLSRNPDASSFSFYRIEDQKVFVQTGNQQIQINYGFDFPAFFASLPRDYNNPYIGKADGFLNTNRAMIYIANPIFDLLSIQPNKVHGYYMMTVDVASLSDSFLTKENPDSQLVINKNGKLLVNVVSQGSSPLSIRDSLQSTITLEQYDLEIMGLKSKNSIQSNLNDITLSIILILCIALPLCLLLISIIQTIVVKRLTLLMQHFKIVQTNPFSAPMLVQGDDEISELMLRFNRMTENLQEHINQVYVTDIQKRNAEYVALKMQINPHFLFNTLESLRMQSIKNGQRMLGEKLYYMGKLFRWMMKIYDDIIPISEELQYMEYYLDLFNMGKTNTIRLEIHSELSLNNSYMLKFSLQPIIENAILHGNLEGHEDPTITLHITRQDDILVIDIHNNGNGISPEQVTKLTEMLDSPHYLPEKHLGLKNIHERIKNYFGETYGLFILAQNSEQIERFGLQMRIPIDYKEVRMSEHDQAINRR
jgi:two-component system sensor histidine kinase YesM